MPALCWGMKFLLPLFLLFFGLAGQAGVYQCLDAQGNRVVSDTVCEGHSFKPTPAPFSQPVARPDSPNGRWVATCDREGCWDKNGARYRPTGDGSYQRSDGAQCRKAGQYMRCRLAPGRTGHAASPG